MHADLVQAPGEGPAFEAGEHPERLEYPEFRDTRPPPALSEDADAARVALVLPQGEVDREFGRKRPIRAAYRRAGAGHALERRERHQRQVDPSRGLRLELPAKDVQGGLRLRAQDHPARLPVQAVNARQRLPAARAGEAHEGRAGPFRPTGGHGQPARLVEGHQKIVLKKNLWKGHGDSRRLHRREPIESPRQRQRFGREKIVLRVQFRVPAGLRRGTHSGNARIQVPDRAPGARCSLPHRADEPAARVS